MATCLGKTIRFPLADDSSMITVGSLPESQLYLPYKGVSRNHFALKYEKSGWYLKDLGSTNGTRVNGRKVDEVEIRCGDLIQAGIVELKIQETDHSKIIRIPEETANHSIPGTDKMTDVASILSGSIFASSKLVFPHGMIAGNSPGILEIFQRLHSLTDSDVNVLLIGETGTGKEMFAQTLHLSGKRSRGPFVAINCAAIPSELIEAELFGIGEKVATDVGGRAGKFVFANKGTLFLDELSAFPAPLQPKILRVIDEKKVTPVGTNTSLEADFRLICATNETPEELVNSGKLREDLYHRIATVELSIPPLRERKGDLPLLMIGLLQQICKKEKKTIAGISDKLFQSLLTYSYPGNIRELVNLLRSMVALAHPGEMLDLHLAPGRLMKSEPEDVSQGKTSSTGETEKFFLEGPVNLRDKVDETTRDWILRALHSNNWNISAAARSLQITRFGLQKMMKRLAISEHQQDDKNLKP